MTLHISQTLRISQPDNAEVRLSHLVALASAVVHAQEGLGEGGHIADFQAFETMVQAAQPLLDALSERALLPVRRDR